MRKIIVMGVVLFCLSDAQGYVLTLPANLAHDVLSESFPTAFAPADFNTEDYKLEWEGAPIPGVEVSLEKGSLDWVRVIEILAIPRARLVVKASGVEAGKVTSAGFTQPMAVQGSVGDVALPVALISGSRNRIEVIVKKGGKEYLGSVNIRFSPTRVLAEPQRVYLDPSCSRFSLSVESSSLGRDEWAYVGCRLVETEGGGYRTSSLEAYVFWDNVGDRIQVGGIPTTETSNSVWPIRLRAAPGTITLQNQKQGEMQLRYSVAERMKLGFFGMGIGPYSYFFEGGGDTHQTWTVLPTFYAAYTIHEALRVVAFDVLSVQPRFTTDFGIYINSEYVKTIDRRLSINLMLGAKVTSFTSQGIYYFKLGAPQGVEVIVTDFFKRAYNLAFGGFLYPYIEGKAYANLWVRWGSPKFFVEFNYISWSERVGESQFSSRNTGISVGFPIARFF